MTDHNTPEYLDKIRQQVVDILRDKEAAPGVGMQGTSICSS
jgi:histone deacetylase 1/2